MPLEVREAAVDVLRDDHWVTDPTSGLAVRSTFLEGAGTNRAIKSEEFDATEWSKVNGTITANAISPPEEGGGAAADLFVEANDVSAKHEVFQLIAAGSGGPPSFGLFAKPAGRNFATIYAGDSGDAANIGLAHYDMVTGQVSNPGNDFDSVWVLDLGNGWVRLVVEMGGPPNAYTDIEWGLYLGDAFGSIEYDGDGASGVYLWGAMQRNERRFDSYIPTTTAKVTRSPDIGPDLPALASTDILGTSYYMRSVVTANENQSGGPRFDVGGNPNPIMQMWRSSKKVRSHFFDSGGTRYTNEGPSLACTVGDLVECAYRFVDNGVGVDMTIIQEGSVNHGPVTQQSYDVPRETAFGSTDANLAPVTSDGLIHCRAVDQLRTLEELRAEAGF